MTNTIGQTRKFSYYSFAKVLSFNATMNHCVGGRGIGKTYGAQKKITSDAIKATSFEETLVSITRRGKTTQEIMLTGTCAHQFVYVRRYKEELAVAKSTFFEAYKHEFPTWDFRVNGDEAQMSRVDDREMGKQRPWVVIGYFIALSVANKYKSTAFPRVKWIVFDEYILEKGATRYLPNEAVAFNNLYSTIDRYKDKTRVLFLANAVSITNPYFIEYKISPDDIDENGFVRKHNGYMVIHFIESDQFEAEVYQTAFGKFIEGTAYADYAVGNQFNDNNKALIAKKSYKAQYMYTIETMNGSFSVWFDVALDKYVCQEKRPKDERIIVTDPKLMSENKTLMTFSDNALAVLRTAFRHDRVRFDTPVSRNAFVEIFK